MALALQAIRGGELPPASDPRVRELRPEQVQKLIDCRKTPRQRDLEGLQAFFEGKQYVGRPSFFDDKQPMQERAPCVVFNLCSIAIESNVAFAMGEGRFPVVLSLSSEDDKTFDKDLGLSKDESEVVDSFNAKLVELARLEQAFRQGYRMAQASRSVAFVLGFRNGLPFAELVWAKLCTPSFDDPADPNKCTRLEIRYRYAEQWRDPIRTNGKWWTRVFEYLRVIDDTNDTVYEPVAIWDETDPGVVERASPVKATAAHGFGLCPVHWYARNRESVVGTNPDGKATHDGVCGLLEQLDLVLSQRHRAAIYAGDPQTVLIGIQSGDAVGNTGRAAVPGALPGEGQGSAKQWQAAFAVTNGVGGKLRRGVGDVWSIPEPHGKAVLLTLPGDALDALDHDAEDLANKACDDMGVTIVDASAFKGAGDLSGRTLSFLFSKQINRVSQDREDLGHCCIKPVLSLFYRMLIARPKGVYLPGLDKVLPILARFDRVVESGKVWFCPQLKLKWGDYFEPSDVDESTRAATAISAYNAKIITLKTAIEHVRSVFAIGSVDQYVDALQSEIDDRQQQAIANAQAIAAPPNGPSPSPSSAGNPAAQKSPNAAPPASGTPKAKRTGTTSQRDSARA